MGELTADFLLEIGTEEIPAGYIAPALSNLKQLFEEALAQNRLIAKDTITSATPRRLALFARSLPLKQDSSDEEVMGPPASVAFDNNGKPTKAAEGFARSKGVDVKDVRLKETDKGSYCCVVVKHVGRKTGDILREILPGIIGRIAFPKSMRWEQGRITFARPVRTILALLGDNSLDFSFNGVASDRKVLGHPFLSDGSVEIASADYAQYCETLRELGVIVDIEERRTSIHEKIQEILSAHGGIFTEAELLDEVTNLVEFPNAVEGSFDAAFLDLPDAVLEEAMKEHQRYFPVRGEGGELLPKFITVINRKNEHADEIRAGNECVLRARLDDARFFWREDQKIPISQRVDNLNDVLFQEKLGSYLDKTRRLETLSALIADDLKLSEETHRAACRAAELCKVDLLTAMVGEFPRLQGVMGREYAMLEGECNEVAVAIAEHYQPRFAGDSLPQTDAGLVVSFADKLDTIVGCFAVGLAPTGSQDPYALRRHTQGIIRMIVEKKLSLNISVIVNEARQQLPKSVTSQDTLSGDVLKFFQDRLYQMCLDRGYKHDLIRATLNAGSDDLVDFFLRLDALEELSKLSEWPDLVEVVERTYNIGKKTSAQGDVSTKLLQEPPEKMLSELYEKHRDEILKLIAARQYKDAALQYAHIFSKPVHGFFDEVFVNVDDEKLRVNRLVLLKKINELFSCGIADLSEIVTGEGVNAK